MTYRDFVLGHTPAAREKAQRHYRRLLEDPPEPVTPRAAATVMLVRDAPDGSAGGAGGLQVYMLKRVASMDFAPSTMVFPGGGIDGRDDADLPWAGPGVVQWAARLGCDDHLTRMLVVAAVREVFEECGVLLASATESGPLVDAADPSWRRARDELNAREISLGELLRRERLLLRTDLLRAHAHWTTPAVEPRRFDTRFFVALMPEHQQADAETTEAEHGLWVRPAEVLEDFAAGRVQMLPPTISCVEDLAAAPDAAACFADEPVIRRMEPVVTLREDGVVVFRVDRAGAPPVGPGRG